MSNFNISVVSQNIQVVCCFVTMCLDYYFLFEMCNMDLMKNKQLIPINAKKIDINPYLLNFPETHRYAAIWTKSSFHSEKFPVNKSFLKMSKKSRSEMAMVSH
jgi:hypothetical protein